MEGFTAPGSRVRVSCPRTSESFGGGVRNRYCGVNFSAGRLFLKKAPGTAETISFHISRFCIEAAPALLK